MKKAEAKIFSPFSLLRQKILLSFFKGIFVLAKKAYGNFSQILGLSNKMSIIVFLVRQQLLIWMLFLKCLFTLTEKKVLFGPLDSRQCYSLKYQLN